MIVGSVASRKSEEMELREEMEESGCSRAVSKTMGLTDMNKG